MGDRWHCIIAPMALQADVPVTKAQCARQRHVPWEGCVIPATAMSSVTSFCVKIPTHSTSPAPTASPQTLKMASETGQLHLTGAASSSELMGAHLSGLLMQPEVTLTSGVRGMQIKGLKILNNSLLIHSVCISRLPKSIKAL